MWIRPCTFIIKYQSKFETRNCLVRRETWYSETLYWELSQKFNQWQWPQKSARNSNGNVLGDKSNISDVMCIKVQRCVCTYTSKHSFYKTPVPNYNEDMHNKGQLCVNWGKWTGNCGTADHGTERADDCIMGVPDAWGITNQGHGKIWIGVGPWVFASETIHICPVWVTTTAIPCRKVTS